MKDEHRIQMTAVRSPLPMNPDGPTLLLGFDPTDKLFAGFDVIRHREFTTGSPSVQISIAQKRQAENDGLAIHRKTNQEIALWIRPDQIVNYALHAADLHRFGKKAQVLGLLSRAVAMEKISASALATLAAPRKRLVQTVTRLSREANFRQQVMRAYGSRCAVTGLQLQLVDAAHILPVGVPGSVDHVSNGLALSPTYHRAYDAGLIYFSEDYVMQLNEKRLAKLRALKLDGGVHDFMKPLGRTICLPPDPSQRPDVRFVRKANAIREIN